MKYLLIELILVCVIAYIAAYIAYRYAFKGVEQSSYDFGVTLLYRIKTSFYKKKKMPNSYDDYLKIEDEDTDEFIDFWYKD